MAKKGGEPSTLPLWQIYAAGTGYFALLAALVFIPAGSIFYWQGWVFLLGNVAAWSFFMLPVSRERKIVAERLSLGPGTEWWDKAYYFISVPAFLGAIALGAYDSARMSTMPIWGYAAGYLLLIASYWIGMQARKANRFFSPGARAQKGGELEVCQAGPYAYVRHPDYAGGMMMGVAVPLCLGSFVAFLPSLIGMTALAARTSLEDDMLRRRLKGYRQYAGRVRYRLFPGIW